MHKLSYDLHIHSCLSPCSDDDMTPANIVNMAKLKKLDVIAVTDHNSCKNCSAVSFLAEEVGILAIPGMELCTAEEVHVLCLFEALEDAIRFDRYVEEKLIKVENNELLFGKQEIYDRDDRKIGTERYLLINATEIPFNYLGELMRKYRGIYIPAHIDKGSNSLISNLGFIPDGADFLSAEVWDIGKAEELINIHSYLSGCRIIKNSDAHSLGCISEPEHFLAVESRNRADVLKALNSAIVL